MDFENINPPVVYESVWLIIFFCALAFIILYVGGVLLFTRKRKPSVQAPVDKSSLSYKESVRKKHMDNIQTLKQESINGGLSSSDLNQRLGVILRSFAAEYSGFNTRPMTLSELRRNNVPKELVDAVESFYPIAFRNLSEGGSPEVAVQAAMDVIYKWN